ncbi:MAG: T9SS type A sorting domain-containing protein [Paludibacter sp.]
MKTKNPGLKPIWLLLFVWVVMFANGQTTNPLQQTVIIVNTVNGEKATLSLKTVQSISFLNGQMNILKKDATQYSFLYANVKSVDFSSLDLTAVNEVRNNSKNHLLINPNPAVDYLNLTLENSVNESVTVQILDLQGKILIQKSITFSEGQNSNSISVSNLHSGLYLCRVLRVNEPLTVKFFKN